jgi:hypothetical protein
MYSPIIRNRQSELLAIRHVAKSIRPFVMPVLDVAAPTKSADKATGLRYVERNLERTLKYVTDFPAVFVDSSELDANFRLRRGSHPLEGAATAVAGAGGQPIPVTGLHRDAAHKAAAIEITRNMAQDKLCVRLDATDVSTATLTHKGIQTLLTSHSIESSQVFLLLDMQCLFGRDKDAVSKQVLRLLTFLEKKTWAGIIVGGYAIPDQLSTAVSTNGQAYLQRIEQDVFRDAAAYKMDTPRWFADYTILPPSVVELDWRLIRKVMTPKALYTLEDQWFVVRGSAFSSHPDEYGQYYSIADEIVALEEYCGSDYSYGDKYISDRSKRADKPGSPGSWITACVNHHITFTANGHN